MRAKNKHWEKGKNKLSQLNKSFNDEESLEKQIQLLSWFGGSSGKNEMFVLMSTAPRTPFNQLYFALNFTFKGFVKNLIYFHFYFNEISLDNLYANLTWETSKTIIHFRLTREITKESFQNHMRSDFSTEIQLLRESSWLINWE